MVPWVRLTEHCSQAIAGIELLFLGIDATLIAMALSMCVMCVNFKSYPAPSALVHLKSEDVYCTFLCALVSTCLENKNFHLASIDCLCGSGNYLFYISAAGTNEHQSGTATLARGVAVCLCRTNGGRCNTMESFAKTVWTYFWRVVHISKSGRVFSDSSFLC